ncbi:MAG: hypothetical protein G01um101416_578 [Microgenomates group bacterium Gr01-1014_16]|nr:MAG: hypothetical protein G01um101416_578 [Microgenomates group bacterium Gr01-1014_16]
MLLPGRGYEYRTKNNRETPFETFLRYTNEKNKLAKKYLKILRERIPNGFSGEISVLDIGAGEGAFLNNVLKKLLDQRKSTKISITLLEPSVDLMNALKNNFPKTAQLRPFFVNDRWEEFKVRKKFDFIFATHLYHFNIDNYLLEIRNMLFLLKGGGSLIFTLRGKDDVFHFKTKFKKGIFGVFRAKTSQVIEKGLVQLNEEGYKTIKFKSKSKLRIPIFKDEQDFVAIMEFYLNYPWIDLDEKIKDSVIKYVKRKKGAFLQEDNIFVFSKAN